MGEAQISKGYTVSLDKTVEWVDTDASGHQHNSVVIRWVEAAEAQLMRELDLPGYFPDAPRVQHIVNFTGMLWFGQQVRVDVWIQSVGRTSLKLGFELTSYAQDAISGGRVAHGTVSTVYVPSGQIVAQPWPEDMRNKFSQVSHD